jgi:D-3-phosphoglycerate dehydrogenase
MVTSPKVLVCDPFDSAGLQVLEEGSCEVTYAPTITGPELHAQVGAYDVLLLRGRTRVDEAVIRAGRRLRLIGRAGVGLDNIDVAAAQRAGIEVLSTPEASTESVAELVIGLMLAVARAIPYADRTLKAGQWLKTELHGSELAGKTLGIVGLGRIGIRVGQLARAFGMRILAHDVIAVRPEVLQELDTRVVPLDELLANSDIVTLHVPGGPETQHLMNAERLARCKRDAILVNASRGVVVDEEALKQALLEGRLAGAGLDVFEREPPSANGLVALRNVVCTPHIGAQTQEGQSRAAVTLAQKVIAKLGRRD